MAGGTDHIVECNSLPALETAIDKTISVACSVGKTHCSTDGMRRVQGEVVVTDSSSSEEEETFSLAVYSASPVIHEGELSLDCSGF